MGTYSRDLDRMDPLSLFTDGSLKHQVSARQQRTESLREARRDDHLLDRREDVHKRFLDSVSRDDEIIVQYLELWPKYPNLRRET